MNPTCLKSVRMSSSAIKPFSVPIILPVVGVPFMAECGLRARERGEGRGRAGAVVDRYPTCSARHAVPSMRLVRATYMSLKRAAVDAKGRCLRDEWKTGPGEV